MFDNSEKRALCKKKKNISKVSLECIGVNQKILLKHC